jgi:alpha-tubulin suppressor-like RCC1 family protein
MEIAIKRALKYFLFTAFFTLLFTGVNSKAFACTNPAGTAGELVYNTNFNVMQHCNGTDWVAWGRPNAGAGSGGCADPVGAEGMILASEQTNQLVYCDGQNWISAWASKSDNVYTAMALDYNVLCALKSDKTLWCRGSDSYGALGNGALTGTQSVFTQEASLSEDWESLSLGQYGGCAIKTNGTLWCWGRDNQEQLGDGPGLTDQDAPVQEASLSTNWSQVARGANHTCAIKTDGTLWCWGNDQYGELGNGGVLTADQDSPSQEITAATDWAQVSVQDGYFTCAVKTNGTLWCWGRDAWGNLGNGGANTDTDSPSQEATLATNWLNVKVRWNNACAIKTDGTLWCWGYDYPESLGTGVFGVQSENTPTQEASLSTDWAFVDDFVGIKTDGSVWYWGRPGSIGHADFSNPGTKHTPTYVALKGEGWSHIEYDSQVCGLNLNGAIYCWGGTSVSGVIGLDQNDFDEYRTQPTEANSDDLWTQISVASHHGCGIVQGSQKLKCWGEDSWGGELGHGEAYVGAMAGVPIEISEVDTWAQVSAGANHTCAIKTNGQMWCWGYNEYGQIGVGTSLTDSEPPQQVSGGGCF